MAATTIRPYIGEVISLLNDLQWTNTRTPLPYHSITDSSGPVEQTEYVSHNKSFVRSEIVDNGWQLHGI